MRLIDADALMKLVTVLEVTQLNSLLSDVKCIIRDAPTIEERKHGHWIETDEYTQVGAYESLYYYKCSVCGALILEDVDFGVGNYCQQCGAIMDEEV